MWGKVFNSGEPLLCLRVSEAQDNSEGSRPSVPTCEFVIGILTVTGVILGLSALDLLVFYPLAGRRASSL
jgi:hypothetical protein